jgi:hypothetical protein
MASIIEQLDLARQVKLGEQFALDVEAGGTGREDGIARGLLLMVTAPSGIAQYQAVKADFAIPSAPVLRVAALTAITDIPIGVVLEAPAFDNAYIPVLLAGVAQVLVTGPITRGDRLYPLATGRLSATAPPNSEGWSIGRAMTTVGAGDTTIWAEIESVAERQPYLPATIEVIMGNFGSSLTTGFKADIEVPFAATIKAVRLVGNPSGSCVIDIWKDTYANFPPTVADSICAAAKPTLVAANKYQDTTLTGWNTALAAGDWLRFNVDSASLAEQVTLSITVLRTVST